MEEVQTQLGPLKASVESQGRTLRSLYSNGSGGPPGYLENARAEDKDWKDRVFRKLDALIHRADKVDDFILEQKTIRTEREEGDKARSAKQTTWFTLLGLVVAVLALLVGWLTYRDSERKMGETAKPVVSSMQNSAALPSQYQPR